MDSVGTRERTDGMTTEHTDEHEDDQQAVPQGETDEDRDQGEHSSRLSTDRDDPPADEDEDTDDPTDDDPTDDEDHDGDTFPRPYVERLRARSAGYRTRATAAEARTGELERALFTERVRALDVLADPTDLPFDADMLDDPDALTEAVADLVRKRPHYRRRGTTTPDTTGSRDRRADRDTVSLTGIMRGHG